MKEKERQRERERRIQEIKNNSINTYFQELISGRKIIDNK